MHKEGKYKWGMFYYNSQDPDIIVKKANGLGWTINFAHKAAIVVSVIFLVLLLCLLQLV